MAVATHNGAPKPASRSEFSVENAGAKAFVRADVSELVKLRKVSGLTRLVTEEINPDPIWANDETCEMTGDRVDVIVLVALLMRSVCT